MAASLIGLVGCLTFCIFLLFECLQYIFFGNKQDKNKQKGSSFLQTNL